MRMERIRAGRIVGAHGVRGELRVRPREGGAELLLRGTILWMDGGEIRPLSARPHKGMVLLRLPGVEDLDAARALRGRELWIGRAEAAETAGVSWFPEELPGMEVVDGETGERLGEVTKVETYPAHDVLTVEGDGRRWLIPAVEGPFLRSVDLDRGRIEVTVWEGSEDDGR